MNGEHSNRIVPGVQRPLIPNEPVLWFLFKGDSLLVCLGEQEARLPKVSQLSTLQIQPLRSLYLGTWDHQHCYAAALDTQTKEPEGHRFEGLRQLWGLMEEEQFWLAGRAAQLVRWDRDNQFCGRCGQPMRDKTKERARTCDDCGLVRFPRISPATITAVRRGNELLLARGRRFPRILYSVIAGFVETGETLEECVHREVAEEAGIRIHNLQYFGSQPWPFPDSLMVAFTAEYLSGEIVIDSEELMDAGWFTPENLPPIPEKISIARRLIDWFVENAD